MKSVKTLAKQKTKTKTVGEQFRFIDITHGGFVVI